MLEQIHPEGLPAWCVQVGAEQRPLVLDVREAWELEQASVQPEVFDLLHIPMGSIPLRWQEWPQNRPIACLCHHGGRSMHVASYLVQQGFTQVVNIAGGIDAWAQTYQKHIPRY